MALFFARKEGIKLPIFAKPKRTCYQIFFYSFAIALTAFLLLILFGGAAPPNAAFLDQPLVGIIGYGLLFFFTGYLLLLVLFSLFFIGGELYWRGYLWEKFKEKPPLKAIWMTALIWSLFQLPYTFLILSYHAPGITSIIFNGLLMVALFFAFTPALTYFRVKCGSIFASTLFYASISAAFGYFMVLFPFIQKRSLAMYGGFTILGLVAFSLIFKLYSTETWKKLKQE